MPMQNIPLLLNDLRNNHWHITAFLFTYNHRQYIVLFEDIENLRIVPNGFLVFLTFLDRADANRTLTTRANAYTFEIDARSFREYFGIEYANNLGDIFQQFYEIFNRAVPQGIVQEYDDELTRAMVARLSRNDGDGINNLCCYDVIHHSMVDGRQRHRSPFNSDKTKLLRPNLFNLLGHDDTVSFCYRDHDPLSDEEICARVAAREGRR